MTIFYIFSSVIIVSLISLVGAIYLALQNQTLEKILFWLISFAAGTLLGGAFIHLLPSLVEAGQFSFSVSLSILGGILLFFILEKVIHWRHCHKPTSENHPHPLATMNIVGDGLHNFLDGVIIASSYFVSPALGIATTIAVCLHEIPQEIGDFGVLIHAGLTRFRALLWNFLSALTAILGATGTIWLQSTTENIIPVLTAFTIGGFIYISTADLLPELKKDARLSASLKQIIGVLSGVAIMGLLLFLE